jgi:hypothetical protein
MMLMWRKAVLLALWSSKLANVNAQRRTPYDYVDVSTSKRKT